MRRIIRSVLGGLIGGALALIFHVSVQAAVIPDGSGGCPFEGELLCKLINVLTETITILLGLGAGVALLFVMIGGIQYMASGGDEKAVSSAKNTITYSIAGLVVILGAILAIEILRDIFGF